MPSKGPGEDVRPQSRITASPMAQHYFVGATPNENSVDGREEWLGVVAGVADHPRGSIEAVGDEPVETHADAVAHSPHCPSNASARTTDLPLSREQRLGLPAPRWLRRPVRTARCTFTAFADGGRRCRVPCWSQSRARTRPRLSQLPGPQSPQGRWLSPRHSRLRQRWRTPRVQATRARDLVGGTRYHDRQRADNGRCCEPEISEVIACVDGTHEPKEHRHRRKQHRHEEQQVVSLGVGHIGHWVIRLTLAARPRAAKSECQASSVVCPSLTT